ncbi:MAG TPA: farnesyl diphosphate synthase [Candidatus Binataceae bacterium]|nr:farnesyl diphosphate synthase [Candidatus Binataceae bacterium]
MRTSTSAQGDGEASGARAPARAGAFKIETYLRARARLIENELARLLARSEGPDGRLMEAMRYSLLAGGKRLRPILALAACEAVGGSRAQAMALACALEMIHTYSLIHDDLPCMDNDDLRRGKPTNHKIFGEALATLAGDGLLTDAFVVLARAPLPPAVLIEVIAEVASAAGASGMVAGQALDILCEGQAITQAQLEYLHARKTGALFLAAVRGGARLGGASAAQLAALGDYGRALGLAFQVIDDILDVEASTEQMGKRTHKDGEHHKVTFPSLLGLAKSKAFARKLLRQALRALEPFDQRAQPLRELVVFVVERSL